MRYINANSIAAMESGQSPPPARRPGWPPGRGGLGAAGLALISTLHYLGVPSGWLRRGVVHVAPEGRDVFLGQSRRFAVRTIQRAADLAEPGETILVWPGIYRETVVLRRGGRPGRPLVLRAALGGALWTTAVDWRGVAAYHSRSLPQLRRLCARPGAWPAFHSSGRQLWLCLPAPAWR